MSALKNCTAVILAGGLGMRLKSVVADRPKVLAEVNGRPFLTYLFDQLIAANISRVVLCTGYLGEMIQEQFGQCYQTLSITYSRETVKLGTGGSLRLAYPYLASDPVLVMNGDSYCRVDLEAAYNWHQTHRDKATMVLTQVPDVQRFGQVRFDQNGLVMRFDEKGANSGPGWINAGIYLLSPAVIQSFPSEQKVSLEREVFPGWAGKTLVGFQSYGEFLDIGTPESYVKAAAFLAG